MYRQDLPLVTAVLVAMLGAVSLQAADWPTYQADARRSGSTAEELKPPLTAQWEFVPPHPPARDWPESERGPVRDDWHYGRYQYGYNSKSIPLVSKTRFGDALQVAAAGDAVYFASSAENRIYALDAAAGKIRWVFYTGAPPRLAPSVWKEKVYFGSDDGIAYCVNAADGKELWRRRAGPTNEMMIGHGRMMSHWPIRTSVLVDKGTAYFGAGLYTAEKLYLFAVNADDGKVIWQNTSYGRGGHVNFSPQGYILAAGKHLAVPGGRICPMLFDRAKGSLRWAIPRGGALHGGNYTMLSADGNTIYNGTQKLLAYDVSKANAKVAWNKPLPAVMFGWFRAWRLLIHKDTAYVVTNAEMLAIPVAKLGEAAKQVEKVQLTLYKNRKNKAKIDAAKKGLTQYLDKTCTWRLPCETPDAFIRAGSVLYAGGKETVVAADATSGKKIWEATVEGHARGLAVSNGRLLVSTTTGSIHCFVPKAAGADGKPQKIEPSVTDTPFPQDRLSPFYAQTAKRIVEETGVKRGYCLILGGGTGRLAYELAKLTQLNIYVAEPDAKKAASARTALAQARLYGARVCVNQTKLDSLPYPPYFANLVIAEETFLTGKLSTPPEELLRVLRPLGGVALVGQPAAAKKLGKAMDVAQLKTVIKKMEGMNAKASVKGTWATVTRKGLQGAGSWSHYYATPGNTGCSRDQLAEAPFRILWVGDPGPRNMLSRHKGPPTPLSVHGRIFIHGADIVMCYDAYNGLPLWERKVPGLTRRGMGEQSGNMVATPQDLFVVAQEKCLQLEAATGKLKQTYALPEHEGGKPRCWGWIAMQDGLLFGSRTKASPGQRYWQRPENISEMLFAIDPASGKTVWSYAGKAIANLSIAAGEGKIFFLEREVTEAQRKQAAEEWTPKTAKGKPAGSDVRLVVALNAKTGKLLWSKPLNVSTCLLDFKKKTVVLKYANNVLLVMPSVPDKKSKGPKAIALAGDTGNVLWRGIGAYTYRALIVGDSIYAAPYAFDLKTGAQKMRGKKPWKLHGNWKCSGPIASAKTLFYRGTPWSYGGMAMYNLSSSAERALGFGGQKPGCTSNMITGNGLLMVPDGTAQCTCDYAIQGTVVLYPKPRK